ncbi:MAG: hypothetical protein OEL81_01305 [Nitrosopumilus sp.]|nr:hypothetical protein [Nitrosopumilus sp.]
MSEVEDVLIRRFYEIQAKRKRRSLGSMNFSRVLSVSLRESIEK